MALELVRHTDGRFDRGQLVRFMAAYQTVAPLTIGELWAWPSMLKLALIENLRRLAEETLEGRASRLNADRYLDQIVEAGAAGPLPRVLETAYVVRLLQRMREYGPLVSPVRAEVEERLAAQGMTAEDSIRTEHQAQAMGQVSVGNAITSLRLLLGPRLDALLRAGQPRRAGAAARSRRGVWQHGFPEPRPVPAGGGGTGGAERRGPAARGTAQRRECAGSRGAEVGRRSCRPRGLPPHRTGPPRPGDRRLLPADPRRATPSLRLRPRHRRLSRCDRAHHRRCCSHAPWPMCAASGGDAWWARCHGRCCCCCPRPNSPSPPCSGWRRGSRRRGGFRASIS